jgi:hypothetical protein
LKKPAANQETVTDWMNSALDGDTNQILQRLNGRVWVDTNRIAELEQQVRTLRLLLYVLLVLMAFFAIVVSLVLTRLIWSLRP